MSLHNFTKEKRSELIERVVDRSWEDYSIKKNDELDLILEEMIYWEKKRVRKLERSWRQEKKIAYWENYKKEYLKGTEEERKLLIKGSVNFYANQIVGNFSPTIFNLSTKVIPTFLNLLLNALSIRRFFTIGGSGVNENLYVSGNISFIRELSKKGTLVFTPTHNSNLDSILLGTALHVSGLPPVMYGAGLNLFRNMLLGFFMNNLGAYKVDRQRIHQLYKDVLKEYAASAIEMGFHNLFFPGGTRSRSGAVEKRLKLGLLGTTIRAYIRNLKSGKAKPNIYVIPVNLNSHLALEAETLIGDFLDMEGKSRFIIENDEFSRPQRVFDFLKCHVGLQSKTFVHLGEPVDPFGNIVNEEGVSVDRHGRSIDASRYVRIGDSYEEDKDRDRNFTQELSTKLLTVFHKNNRALSTNLVAFTLYEMIVSRYPHFDVYHLMRTYAYEHPIALRDLYKALERVVGCVTKLAGQKKILYGRFLRGMDVQDIVNDALKIFATYHKRKTIYRVGDQIFVGDLLLLYFYHNRLIGYNLEDMVKGEI